MDKGRSFLPCDDWDNGEKECCIWAVLWKCVMDTAQCFRKKICPSTSLAKVRHMAGFNPWASQELSQRGSKQHRGSTLSIFTPNYQIFIAL